MEVVKNSTACNACTYRCLKTHSVVNDFVFFKVMRKETFNVLELPNECRSHFRRHGDTYVRLRGADGRLWSALVHFVENRLYVTEGWSSFVKDNSLRDGDIVLFWCIDDLYFLVQIFEQGTEKFGVSSGDICNPFYKNFPKLDESDRCAKSVGFPEGFHSHLMKNLTCKISPADRAIVKETHTVNNGTRLFSTKTPKACSSTSKAQLNPREKSLGPNVEFDCPIPEIEFDSPNPASHSKETQGSLFDPIVLDDEEDMDSTSSLSGASLGERNDSYHLDSDAFQERALFAERKNFSRRKARRFEDGIFSVTLKAYSVNRPYVLNVPKHFCDSRLPRRKRTLTLFHKDRNWRVVFNGDRRYPTLSRGFVDFVKENNLQLGDKLTFSMPFKNGLSMKIDITRRN